jgi:hypothetical protein
MLIRTTIFSISVAACAAAPLLAQNPTPAGVAGNVTVARNCDTTSPVTVLGFTFAARLSRGVGANTVYGASGNLTASSVSYADEPLVGRVDEDGPAEGKLRSGDLIARVNGYAITTPEGAAALSSARPGVSLVLTVRRGENLVPVTIIPRGARCPLMLGGTYGPAANAYSTTKIAPSIVQGMSVSKLAPGNSVVLGQTSALMRTAINGGWLGIGFDCEDCGQRAQGSGRVWYFREAPVIYNVDTGSPAYNAGIRRGDVLLRVDGKDITTAAAGARLGQVKVGEKLNLTYRRGSKVADATLRVAQSPLALRASTVNGVEAEQILKSTMALRASTTTEARLREMLTQNDAAKAKQEAAVRELETVLWSNGGAGSENARAVLGKLRAAQESQLKNQERALTEMLRNEEEGARRLNLLEQQMKHASRTVRPSVIEVTGDSIAFARTAVGRDQKLRYSGSVAGADVEVRGPGSVSVQGDGDDLVIITADAIIRIKSRKPR